MNTFIRVLDALGPLWWPLAVTTILLVYRRTLQRWAERTELTEAGFANLIFKFTGREVERIAEEVEDELEEAAVAVEKGALEPGEVRERLHEILERSNLDDLHRVNMPVQFAGMLKALERDEFYTCPTCATDSRAMSQRLRDDLVRARGGGDTRVPGIRRYGNRIVRGDPPAEPDEPDAD